MEEVRIPEWYRVGMSTQIAVRLPDELVEHLDRLVSSGDVESRAAAVKIALERDRRRRLYEADVVALGATPDADDLDDLAAHVATVDLDLD